jgi:hypothetical protein
MPTAKGNETSIAVAVAALIPTKTASLIEADRPSARRLGMSIAFPQTKF